MLALRSGQNAIVVAPEAGAGVLGWMFGATPILRRALPGAAISGNPHLMGWFPLLPYANRIGQARFPWLGAIHAIARNFGDRPHAIHGIGWQRPWAVEAVSASAVTMSLDHAPDAAWPFAFHAEIAYQMSPRAITVRMAIRNRHDTPAPAGLGLHPYFTRMVADPWLQFAADGVWNNGPDALPASHDDPDPDQRFTTARPVRSASLDNCFTGWDRRAMIEAGAASLRIEASPVFRHVQVFTPGWADFFCVEPVTHVPDALNRLNLPPDHAMHVLQPGDSLCGIIVLTITR